MSGTDVAKNEYATWLTVMISEHPEEFAWVIPSSVEPTAFRSMIRALYLAGYGPKQAADLADDLFPWPPGGPCRYVERLFDLEFQDWLPRVNDNPSVVLPNR